MTDGRRIRILTVIDNWTRECLALVADASPSGRRVARELDAIIAQRGHPDIIVSDNGTELALHRTGQAAAERLQRELQRPAAGRAAERDTLPIAAPCPRRAGDLASRLQRGSTAPQARLDDTQGLHPRPIRRRRPTTAQINLGLSLSLEEKRGSRKEGGSNSALCPCSKWRAITRIRYMERSSDFWVSLAGSHAGWLLVPISVVAVV
jgi:hypothetical protein